jgi:pilus assembly protein CpaE
MNVEGDWDALIISPDREMGAELRDLLSVEMRWSRLIDWETYPTSRVLGELTATAQVNLCFLDICSDQEQAFGVLSHVLGLPSRLAVVALLTDNNPELILRCLRRGAVGFLLHPFSVQQLQPVLQKVEDLLPAEQSSAPNAGKIFCVASAKGSSGATTIASNLACQSKLLGLEKVLLADMDPLTGTLSFLLKLPSHYNFLDALTHAGDLDGDLWKALVSSYRGVDVLSAPDSPLDSGVESQDASQIVEYCRRAYDVVFLDSGGPYGAWNLGLANLSDELLLVLTAEVPAIYATQRALAFLDRNGVDRSKIRLLVNRYRRDAGLGRTEIETALGMEVFYLLPNDREATENALMEGRPVPSSSQFGKSLAELTTRLSDREVVPKKIPSSGTLFSLFSRRR